MHGEGLLRLHRKIDLLVRRTQSTQVLRVECAEGCRDGWPDAYDALLYSGPKQCNPKIAAEEQLRAAHRGRAPGMGRAINLHLLDRLPCIVHEAAPTGMCPFLFISVYNARLREIGCEFLWPTFVQRRIRIFTDTRIHRAPDCAITWQERNIQNRDVNYCNQIVGSGKTRSVTSARSISETFQDSFRFNLRATRTFVNRFDASSLKAATHSPLRAGESAANCTS